MSIDPLVVADYDAALFVVREEVRQRLLARVGAWQTAQQGAGVPAGDQVVILAGERGVGKTWLLRHLAEQDPQVAPLAVYLDLEERLGFSMPEHYVEAVKERIRQRRGGAEAILLLDTVPSQLDESLRALEDAVLRPHLTQRGSLAIMALMHPSQVCWRAPVLRAGERYPLAPFDQAQTREQLQRLGRAGLMTRRVQAATIQRYSGGLPLLNYLLATRARAEAFEALLAHWFSRVPPDERERIRRYLEVVCTLDVLEHAPIRRMLELFCSHCPDVAECPAHPIGVLNLLRKYWLGQPAPGSPGCIILVGSVGRAVRELLKARDADLYAKLEEAAHGVSRRRE